MKKKEFSRRKFIYAVRTASPATAVTGPLATLGSGGILNKQYGKLAIFGGDSYSPGRRIGALWS